MTTGSSQKEIREEHTRAEAHDRAKQEEELLLTDVDGKDTQKATDDLEEHKLPSIFSYRQAYFVGAQAQLAKVLKHRLDGPELRERIFNEALSVMEDIRKTHESDIRFERITSDVKWEFRKRWQALKEGKKS